MNNIFSNNKSTWEREEIVSSYEKKSCSEEILFPPENTILDFIKSNQFDCMLDIGIGAGRTTSYFAPYVTNYYGIDYSNGMVDSCQERFNAHSNINLEVMDARNMQTYSNNSMDFILFSYNGIDYVDNDDRTKILHEMHRICKPNGYISFSTHNIYCIKKYFKLKFTLHPFKMLNYFRNYIKFLINNPGLKNSNTDSYIYVNDPGANWGLLTYYVNPNYQLDQLSANGFYNIKMFDLVTGLENSSLERLKIFDNKWVYYLAKKNIN